MNTWQRKTLVNHWWFAKFLPMSRDKNKESKQAVIRQSFIHQTFTLYSIAKAELCVMSLHGKSFSKNFKFLLTSVPSEEP